MSAAEASDLSHHRDPLLARTAERAVAKSPQRRQQSCLPVSRLRNRAVELLQYFTNTGARRMKLSRILGVFWAVAVAVSLAAASAPPVTIELDARDAPRKIFP